MVDQILQAAKESTYDFRTTALATDPLSFRFPDWIPYYRLKWAIAKVLAPRRILEIGVRYGYSALAFLDACPGAYYVGIDLDSEKCGGVRGSIYWAQQAASQYDAHFMIADSQAMAVFPGGHYDLIHVDGQQDGEGSIHDISVALRQADYVLVDGYFWIPENFWYISECLLRYKALIEYCVIIPGYAGELLIRTRRDAGGHLLGAARSSRDLQAIYTRDFYLNRLRGCDDFKRDQAKRITTPWHAALSLLAETAPAGGALDLGCGRGELAVCFARQGRNVVAVDFSKDAIQLAAEAVAGSELPEDIVRFVHADVNEAPLETKFQVIAVSDLIQRLSETEMVSLFARIAEHLEPSGLFLLYARPNAWFVRYGLPGRKRRARVMGAHVPSTHLNDAEAETFLNPPSPASLKRHLRQVFRHSVIWFGDDATPLEGLCRDFSRHDMKEASMVLAAASNGPLSIESLRAASRMDALPTLDPGAVRVRFLNQPETLAANSLALALVELKNETGYWLRSVGSHPVHLSYHWMDESGDQTIVHDGARTSLVPSLAPGRATPYWMLVQAPPLRGRYVLRITVVQEGVRWMDSSPQGCCATATVQVIL